ncbi:hypothetical protein EST38_g9154 [Candolleomyces aberdarensis]|uniref:Uncharacterized protein n=1 Tax=Candolleomyces aberdarensis TaxID=2316362 RepID=A0A4Q2DAU0_9AGAR|nr:hypothetical protein EST38_g9154 [Candolleomyces aberdarensis]
MAPKPAPRAPTAPASKACNKGGMAPAYAPSPNDNNNKDTSSVNDKSTPWPLGLFRPPSRPHSAAAHLQHAPYLPATNRNDCLSSNDQLSTPVFSADPTYPPSQHAGGSVILPTTSSSSQWSNFPDGEWTGMVPTPSGNWGQDDVLMSDVHSALTSLLDSVAQWFDASAPPHKCDDQAWNDVRLGNDKDGNNTIRPSIWTPKPSKGKGRVLSLPLLPPFLLLLDDPHMNSVEDNA